MDDELDDKLDDKLDDEAFSDACASFVAASSSYLDEVEKGLFGRMSDAGLLAELREREVLLRRQATADQELLAELERRGVASRLSMPSTAAMLQAMLLISPHEAKRRMQDAAIFASRVSVAGQVLPPERPLVARAQAAGVLTLEQAR